MKTYIHNRSKSFGHAFNGIRYFLAETPNARIHLLVSLFAISLGIVFSISLQEWCITVLTIAMVLSMEALNSGLESLADASVPEYHPLIKKAKDLAASAVLIASLGALAIGFFIFAPYILAL